jgi:drug/metabolite transporter (DMT)-like permease
MFALFLTIVCSTSIALILKYNDTRGGNPLLLLTANYFVAAIIGYIFILADPSSSYSTKTLLFGAFLAMLFVASFFSFAKAVTSAGTALATVSSRLSVIVPLILSMLIYREKPSYIQMTGLVFALITIILFYYSLRNAKVTHLKFLDYFYLLAVLIGIGLSDFGMKVFQQWRPQTEKPYFIFTIFLCSFFYTFIIVMIQGIQLNKPVIIRGGILGIPNVFSTFFLLLALAQLPAILVYPMTNIGIILFTALGAAVIWKEKLNRFGKLALFFGILAIALLGL